jgi:hypothetical protein
VPACGAAYGASWGWRDRQHFFDVGRKQESGNGFVWFIQSRGQPSHAQFFFDLGPKNIRVNAIAPGATQTQALSTVLTPEIEQKMLAHTPLKRLGKPEDMANAALFLCAPASNWISGQILTVSGGGFQELD